MLRDMSAGPDILWIVTTQWRAQACGYAGDPNARTPHLDALAAQSVNYTQAVTPHPFGPFARAAMLTGVFSPANGVRDYFDPLPDDARTIAHEMKARGYATAFFGKWHLAKRDRTAPLVGEAHAKTIVPSTSRGGFEFWEGFEGGFLLNDPWLHGSRLPEPARFEGYQSDVVGARAAEWLRGSHANAEIKTPEARRPWFAVVSLEAPHPPYDASAPGVIKRSSAEIILSENVPRGGAEEARARRELAGYYAHIEATDRAIGRLLATLDVDARNRGRPAPRVIFTSVHGDMHGAHGLFRKGWPHEESVRVPLLVREEGAADGKAEAGSASRKAGRSDGRAVSLVDLPRMTITASEARRWATACGGEKDGGAGSFSVISMPSVVALPDQCDRRWRGVRTAKRKLILQADGSPWLFFDLEHDPGELRNLVGAPEWAAEIAAWRERVPADGC